MGRDKRYKYQDYQKTRQTRTKCVADGQPSYNIDLCSLAAAVTIDPVAKTAIVVFLCFGAIPPSDLPLTFGFSRERIVIVSQLQTKKNGLTKYAASSLGGLPSFGRGVSPEKYTQHRDRRRLKIVALYMVKNKSHGKIIPYSMASRYTNRRPQTQKKTP